jgi:lysozyme
MNNLKQVKQLIEIHEGCKLTVYDDATGEPLAPGDMIKGHPTIGKGRALDVKGISEAEADLLLDHDIENVLKALQGLKFSFWEGLSALRKAVLVDMAYNMGAAGLMNFKKMLSALQVNHFDEAAAQMEQSLWFTQTGLRAKQDYCLMKFNRWFTEDEAEQYFAGAW